MAQNFALRVQKPTFKSVVKQVMRNLPTSQFILRMEGFLSLLLEDFKCTMREEFQHIVRQELDRRFQPLLLQLERPSLVPVESSSTQTRLQLQFINSPAGPLFSRDRLTDEDGSPITVELVDTSTHRRIASDHPLSSIKVEIVALKGDFDQEIWTQQEFAMNILSEREKSGKLLIGDSRVTLREGLGVIENLVVTDSSHWTGNGKFRLGAVLVTSCSSWTKVKQAKSEAFVVKSERSKANQKHYPPTPQSEIWRLHKIAKNGRLHVSLVEKGICYVRDFLCAHWMNPDELPEMLRKTGLSISEKFWGTIVSHALKCKQDSNLFFVYNDNSHGIGLLFNSRYKLIEASVDEQGFQPLDQLTPPQKKFVDAVIIRASKCIGSWVQIDKLAYAELPRKLISVEDEPSGEQLIGTEQSDLSLSYQAQIKSLVGSSDHPAAASADTLSAPQNAPTADLLLFSEIDEDDFLIGDMIWNDLTGLEDGTGPMMSNAYSTVMDETRIPLPAATQSPMQQRFNKQTDCYQSHVPAFRPDKILESLCSSSSIRDPIHKFFSEALRNSFRFTDGSSSSADHGGEWPCSMTQQPFRKSSRGSTRRFIARCSSM